MYLKHNTRKTFDEFFHGVLTGPEVYKLVQQILDTQQFFELEPAEVLEIALEEDHLPLDQNNNPDYSFLGAVKARLIYSQHSVSKENLSWIKPLDDSAISYPIEGEYVIIGIYLNTQYYISKINILSAINNNSAPGLSTSTPDNITISENFLEDNNIKKLQPNPGDSIYQGRFGNSIRFGKLENLPTILIRAGQLNENTDLNVVKEDINLDGSSIWITSGGFVNLIPGYESALVTKFNKKQIILNSDNIILNTKNGGDIALLSNQNIIIGSTLVTSIESPEILLQSDNIKIKSSEILLQSDNTTIDSSAINLGAGATESLVLGNKLVSILQNLITTLSAVTIITPAGPGTLSPPNITKLGTINAKLRTILSLNHKTT